MIRHTAGAGCARLPCATCAAIVLVVLVSDITRASAVAQAVTDPGSARPPTARETMVSWIAERTAALVGDAPGTLVIEWSWTQGEPPLDAVEPLDELIALAGAELREARASRRVAVLPHQTAVGLAAVSPVVRSLFFAFLGGWNTQVVVALSPSPGDVRVDLAVRRFRTPAWRTLLLGVLGAAHEEYADHASFSVDPWLRATVLANAVMRPGPVSESSIEFPGAGYAAIDVDPSDGSGNALATLVSNDGVSFFEIRSERARRTAHPIRFLPWNESIPRTRFPRRFVATLDRSTDGLVLRTNAHAGAALVRRTGEPSSSELAPLPCSDPAPTRSSCIPVIEGRDDYAGDVFSGAQAFYTRRRVWITAANGSPQEWIVTATTHGRLVVFRRGGNDDPARRVDIPRGSFGEPMSVGAALAVADWDIDGLPELLVSSGSEIGDGDQLALLRLHEDGVVESLWTSSRLPGSILIVEARDLDRDGLVEFLAVEESLAGRPARLWVVR